MTTAKQGRLLLFMQEATGNSLDVYHRIYKEYLHDEENPSSLLPVIFEYCRSIGEDNGTPSDIMAEAAKIATDKYKKYLLETVNYIAESNVPSEEFYTKLWDTIFCSTLAPKEVAQRAVTLKLLKETVRILPYYQAHNLVRMDDEEFSARMGSIEPRLLEAVHMLNRHFPQKTEEVSQLQRISEGLSKQDACVFWSAMSMIWQEGAFDAGYAKAKSELRS